MRTLNQIAKDIPSPINKDADFAAWKLRNLTHVTDYFGYETGAKAVADFLTAANTTWIGQTARRIKLELEDHLRSVDWVILDTQTIDDPAFKKALIQNITEKSHA